MTPKPCSKSWQVEAIRDRRLSGRALGQAEQHISSCAACSAEQNALLDLSRQLRKMDGEGDELALRRLRELTLARAVAASREPVEATSQRRKIAKWVLLVAAAFAAALWASRPAGSERVPGIQVVATPSAGAVWTMNRSGESEYIDLADGLLSVSVRHVGSNGRLVVRLPDGQVEDVGTRFRVWVSQGRTAEIRVWEGVVVFRRPGEGDLVIRAGSSWGPSAASSEMLVPGVAAAPPAAVVPSAAVSAPRARSSSVIRRAAASATAPSDTLLEDAAYLHLVALLREHRGDEARLAAAAFLRDFPNAFRRVEVERIIQATSETTGGAPRAAARSK